MERQVAALIQQVTEMTDRLRQNEEPAEQARQLLEADRTPGQMLEERMSWTEANVRDASPAGGASWTIRICSVCGEIRTRELQWRRHWME